MAKTAKEILALGMPANDAKAATIRDYLKALLTRLWEEEEGFDGKRPFGYGGWQGDVRRALVMGGVVRGDEGYPEDTAAADQIVLLLIDAL